MNSTDSYKFLYLHLIIFDFRGVGVQMVEPLYQSPSFDGVLPSLVFLQVFTRSVAHGSRLKKCAEHKPDVSRCRTFPL